jgi:hypothetical protein
MQSGVAGEIVLIGMAVTGNKDRPFVITLAEGLAGGINALRFSSPDNGTSAGYKVIQLHRQQRSGGISGAVISAVQDKVDLLQRQQHGWGVGVLRAAKDSGIKALILPRPERSYQGLLPTPYLEW